MSCVLLPMAERLKVGRRAEELAIDVLNTFVGPTVRASSEFDMGAAKLDAWVTNRETGEELAAQLKMRESGADILVEWYQDYSRRVEGRDKTTHADLYVVMDPTWRRLHLVDANRVKQEAHALFCGWRDNYGEPYKTPKGVCRAQYSRDIRGAVKVMVYLKPALLGNAGVPGWQTSIAIPEDFRTGKRARA